MTVDVVSFYPIPYQVGLSSLKEAVGSRSVKRIPTENLVNMAEVAWINNCLETISKVFWQIPRSFLATCALVATCDMKT